MIKMIFEELGKLGVVFGFVAIYLF